MITRESPVTDYIELMVAHHACQPAVDYARLFIGRPFGELLDDFKKDSRRYPWARWQVVILKEYLNDEILKDFVLIGLETTAMFAAQILDFKSIHPDKKNSDFPAEIVNACRKTIRENLPDEYKRRFGG